MCQLILLEKSEKMDDNLEHRLFRQLSKKNKQQIFYENFNELYSRYKSIYRDFLYNILINLFKYENLPRSFNARGFEFLLRNFGYANIYCSDSKHVYVSGIGIDSPAFNFTFGSIFAGINSDSKKLFRDLSQKSATLLTRMNLDESKKSDNPTYVTVPNKFSFYFGSNVSDSDLIEQTADTLAEIKASMILNIRQQKTPFIGFTKDKNLTAVNIFNQLENGKPFIQVDGEALDNNIKNILTTIPVQVPNLSATLQDSWNNTLTEFLNMTGISNTNVDKKERLVTAETQGNDGLLQASLNVYLQARQDQLDLLNDVYDTNFKVSLNEEYIDKLNQQEDYSSLLNYSESDVKQNDSDASTDDEK